SLSDCNGAVGGGLTPGVTGGWGRKRLENENCYSSETTPKNAHGSSRPVNAVLGGSSLPCSITEENHAVAKAALLQKLELQFDIVREGLFSSSHYDRREE